ncbi:MAG: RecX family transcriptional regulator [Firmicutes bacterium]|nr:RecX family transcriptional regulator [Bacillota bacterium]
MEKVVKKTEKEKRSCKEEALFWLEYGDRTEKEMVQHLKKKGYDEREIAECMAFLVDLSFIDDRRYALKFVEISMEKRRGPLRVRHELQEKGITGEIVDEAIANGYDRTTERELALELAEKALRKVDDSGEEELDDWGNPVRQKLSDKDKAKILRKLAAAGFSAGAAYDAIGRLKR